MPTTFAATPPRGTGADPLLSSALARACLPHAARDEEHKFAWVAAVSLLFLGVGIYGLFARPVSVAPKPSAVDENIPVLFESTPPPAVDIASPLDLAEPDASVPNFPPPAPVVVAVAEPTEAAFAVPVERAAILAPARIASAPPIDLRASAAPTPSVTQFTPDSLGKFPPPLYPRTARERHLQGKLLLLVAVEPNGLVERVEVRETSGSELLDQHSAEWVKHRWVWPPGTNRLFHVPVIFELK